MEREKSKRRWDDWPLALSGFNLHLYRKFFWCFSLASITHPSILIQIKEARMGVGKPRGWRGFWPQLFNDLSLNPLIRLLLPVIEVGWVGGGHVQKAEVWLREDWDIYATCCLFILICLVCLTGEVTWFKVYELSLFSADSWLLWLDAGCSVLFCCLKEGSVRACMCVCVCVCACAHACVRARAYCADGTVP